MSEGAENNEVMVNGYNGYSSSSSSNSSASDLNPQVQADAVDIVQGEAARPNERTSREASRLTGTVKWFNAKNGYGFITRHDTGDDIFIHFSGIARKNPRHSMKSLGDGEIVEFNLMATNVTGMGGEPVRGNPYVSHLPTRRNDSFASGDPPNYRLFSRIPRWSPNWILRR